MSNQPLIQHSIEIAAPPAAVWAIVSDLRRMGEWSPQCVRMTVLGREVGVGTRTINLNRDGWKRWPTSSRVVVFEPEQTLAFRVPINRTVWTYELEPSASGTVLTESRRAPSGVSRLSNIAVGAALGGTEAFEASLSDGIRRTLERIKAEAEAS
ncbi:SRPBCC family protein [Aeromicrobium endophyticum]|uniref:SRPBCC family protein n=1 Tax=Aeromicrobium endophyticum TaxID=2292704 RepID=A0A371P468_9ACTN|nr:SRPBCC family protein [Aeromicrobium endophyticum]REK70731.1 SRPBCC family protein [Aeromicrobium endophyticum]